MRWFFLAIGVCTLNCAKPPQAPKAPLWRFTGGPTIGFLPHRVVVIFYPPPGSVDCPSFQVLWGDGSLSGTASDCVEGAPAIQRAFYHTYVSFPEDEESFLITATIEVTGVERRAYLEIHIK